MSKPDYSLIYTCSGSTAIWDDVFVDDHRDCTYEISVLYHNVITQGYNLYYTNNSILQHSKLDNNK